MKQTIVFFLAVLVVCASVWQAISIPENQEISQQELAPQLGYAPNLTGPDWESLDPASKQDQINALIYSDNTSTTFYNPLEEAGILLESMNLTFDTVADDMPAQGWPVALERPKFIHTVGAIAPAKYTPVDGNGFTGIFETGSTNMYIRFSMAAGPTTDPVPVIIPGISLKFLRNGVESGNIVSMFSLGGQQSFNFFEHDLSNHPPFPDQSNMSFAQKQLFEHFQTASHWPTMVGLSNVAMYGQDGSQVPEPKFPFRLIFHPYTNIHNLFPSTPSSDEYYYLPQLESLTAAPIFYVYAEVTPGSNPVHIGDLEITAPPSGSNYADLNLFFQHTRMENDFEFYPDWVPLAEAINAKQASIPGYTYPDLPFN